VRRQKLTNSPMIFDFLPRKRLGSPACDRSSLTFRIPLCDNSSTAWGLTCVELRESRADTRNHAGFRRIVGGADTLTRRTSQASEVCQNQLRLKVCGAPAFQQAATTNEIVRDASISTTPQMSTVAQLRKRTTATP
jgi:hypothetical protein